MLGLCSRIVEEICCNKVQQEQRSNGIVPTKYVLWAIFLSLKQNLLYFLCGQSQRRQKQKTIIAPCTHYAFASCLRSLKNTCGFACSRVLAELSLVCFALWHLCCNPLKAYVYVCLLSYLWEKEARLRIFILFAIKFNEMKKYFREWKHISALFKAYQWEYQPDDVVQGIRNHSVLGSFQQVLTT